MYNKAILVGRLTANPELKQTPNGVSVTSFSIAVNRSHVNKQTGQRDTDFIDIVAWRSTAEFICRYFAKGRPILIDGSIQTRTYVDKQGQNRRVWEIVADNAHFVESKNDGGQNQSEPEGKTENSTEDFSELADDGDLPF